jgi:hypothetical protein
MQKWQVTSVYVAIPRLDQDKKPCSATTVNDGSIVYVVLVSVKDFLSFHFLNTTFDLIAIKANGQWLVLLFFNYHLWLTVKQIIN